jgi:hypothetical protein
MIHLARSVPAGISTLIVLGLTASLASAQEKPSLAAEIRSVLESEGVEAAQARFDELYPDRKDEYAIDPKGFAEMGSEAMQSGDMATAQVVMRMVQQISQDMLADQVGTMPAGASGGGAQIPSAREAAEAERRREQERGAERGRVADDRAAAVRERLGQPRDDLERFAGIYGDPDRDPPRDFFVAVRCDGYLVIGATRGDAQNWYLRSRSELDFETETFGGETITFGFTLGGDGRPVALTHSLEDVDSPMPYRMSLQEFGWPSECVQPRGG